VIDYRLDDDSKDFSADLLIKALILQIYFEDFTRLFSDTARKDLVSEFLDYEQLRAAIRSGESLSEAAIAPVFEFYRIARPAFANGRFDDPDTVVRLLDASVPKDFLPLVARADFVELLRGIAATGRPRIVERVLRTRLRAEAEREASRAAQSQAPLTEPRGEPALPLAGLRVLWIDANPRNTAREADEIRRAGGTLEQVTDARTARDYLAASEGDSAVVAAEPKYHVLVSSIQRPDRPEGGIEEAAAFRKEQLHRGPIIFYTQRITGRRQQLAAAIEAQITDKPEELHRLLRGVAAVRTRAQPVA
jgi:hypothetical protein